MTALSEFTDFQNMTPPIYITGPQEMVNDALVQAPLLGRLLLNRDMNKILQGGSTIRDTIKISVATLSQNYTPGQPVGGYANRQTSNLNEIRYRYMRSYMSWTEAELMQNVPAGLTNSMRSALHKKLSFSKESSPVLSVTTSKENLANPSIGGPSMLNITLSE